LLWREYAESPATTRARRPVERFLPLARHLARRYAGGGEDDDLVQVASVGLLKAIDRFDPAPRQSRSILRGCRRSSAS